MDSGFVQNFAFCNKEKHQKFSVVFDVMYISSHALLSFCCTYSNSCLFCNVLQNPEDYPEYPKISRKYFVEFLFINDAVSEETRDNEMSSAEVIDCSLNISCHFIFCRLLLMSAKK